MFGWPSVLQPCWDFGNTHALVPVLESDTAHPLPILGCSWSCINEAEGGNGFVLMLTWLSTKMQVLLPLCFSTQHLGQEAAWKGQEEKAEVMVEFYRAFYPASFKTLIMTPAALHFLQHFPFVGIMVRSHPWCQEPSHRPRNNSTYPVCCQCYLNKCQVTHMGYRLVWGLENVIVVQIIK